MSAASAIHRYHDGTKHHLDHFARSLGYLDWASQPRPFRTFSEAPRSSLFPDPASGHPGPAVSSVSYPDLFERPPASAALTAGLVGDVLRHALGLSAWKIAGTSRWALRVNPSSGNLHPTEAYVWCPPVAGLASVPTLFHYAADTHALEARCRVDADQWRTVVHEPDAWVIALTSIHWREAWKYGERAFRYCQHDMGHAIAAVALAARLVGWRAELLPGWPHGDMAAVTGVDRDEDFVDAEREEPGALIALVPVGARVPEGLREGHRLASVASRGVWTGHASQLSEDHVEWTFIDEVATATRATAELLGTPDRRSPSAVGVRDSPPDSTSAAPDARRLMMQRRSAVAFDGRSAIEAEVFFSMMARLLPDGAPWDTLWWPPSIHLAIFVYRVTGLEAGLYLLERSAEGGAALRAAFGREFLNEQAHDRLPLVRLARGDCRSLARRLSCDQDIASEGFFSLAMIAEFDASLARHGDAFYRQLFWESGVVGQMLYLEAEAAGVRGTGIGCFYDDAVHDVLGLRGHAFQSLYHFTVGAPVEDRRLTTAPGYAWESSS